jgi:small conductance mechanosensitive channel
MMPNVSEGAAMLKRAVFTSLIVATLITLRPSASVAQSGGAPPPAPDPRRQAIATLIADTRRLAMERDSIFSRADSARGASRDFLEELIWQRHVEISTGLLALAEKIKAEKNRGRDVTEFVRLLNSGVPERWSRHLALIQRWEHGIAELTRAGDAASGAQRLAIETDLTRQSERLLEAYRMLVNVLLAFEKLEVDLSKPRAFLVHGLPTASQALVTRVRLAKRDQLSAASRLARDASNADLRYAFEAADERLNRATRSLTAAIALLDRLGLPNTEFRVALIATTGQITTDIFQGPVLLGLVKVLWTDLLAFLGAKAPHWLFKGFVITLTFLAFRALARLARAVARRAVKFSQLSQLMRSTIVRLAGNAVMLIGFVVILTQLGVQLAPLLAGLGIAGFVVGFALQNTLSNFAAGGMILGTQPFDVGDDIEVAGTSGIVKKMSLVSTTILTPDNQTLIVPNSTIWGGVIRNRTAQPIRRVDLMFGIDYADDLEKAERVLQEVVAAHKQVMHDPAPIIKLHQLADSSVNYIVRVWTGKDSYWQVYWDLTRSVKLRFDAEGISIPFPQRDVHVKTGDTARPDAEAGGAPPRR